MYYTMSSAKWRPFCSGRNALTRPSPNTCVLWFVGITGADIGQPPIRLNAEQAIGQSLLWRHNGHEGVSQPHDCLLNRSFRHISKKSSKLRVTGLRAGNSPVTGELPAQIASNAENVSIWWHHHGLLRLLIRSALSKSCAMPDRKYHKEHI